jgi:hypothetical protein
MIWLLLIIPAVIIAIAVYFERRNRRQVQEDHLSVKDHQALEQDYISHGSGNESTKPENL